MGGWSTGGPEPALPVGSDGRSNIGSEPALEVDGDEAASTLATGVVSTDRDGGVDGLHEMPSTSNGASLPSRIPVLYTETAC